MYDRKPIPVASRSKAWVYGRSRAGIEGSNPAGGIKVCPLWVMFVFRYMSLFRGDNSPEESYRV